MSRFAGSHHFCDLPKRLGGSIKSCNDFADKASLIFFIKNLLY